MGVDVDAKKYKDQKALGGRQKLRAGVFAVMALGRMQKMVKCWKQARMIGEARN